MESGAKSPMEEQTSSAPEVTDSSESPRTEEESFLGAGEAKLRCLFIGEARAFLTKVEELRAESM